MNYPKEIKQAVVSRDFHSPFVREMVKTWTSSIKEMPHEWLQLVSAVLDYQPQLMFKYYFRKELKIIGQQGKAKGLETSHNQILGEDTYADPQVQALYNEEILSLCNKAALNA